MIVLIVVLLTRLSGAHEDETCSFKYLDDPIARQDGDLVLGALVKVAESVVTVNGSEECDHTKAAQWGIQKALALRRLIDQYSPRFKDKYNMSLGYEFYDTCNSPAVVVRASSKLISNPKLVGVATADGKELIDASAIITASFNVPTYTYIYNDDSLIGGRYSTMYSMIDTEVVEAKITIQFLRKMGYKYMDIWHHPFSKEMSEYIYNEYLLAVEGCGRIAEVPNVKSAGNVISETYAKTGGNPSKVQMIMHNSKKTSVAILKELVEVRGFKNTIYVFGISNGRRSYLDTYKQILHDNNCTNSTLVLSLPDLLNSKLTGMETELGGPWVEERDEMDDMYRDVQSRKCPGNETCTMTSWVPLVLSGAQFLLERLFEILGKFDLSHENCIKDLTSALFDDIVKENRTITIDLDEENSVNVSMKNRTLNTGYSIGVYQTRTETFSILGRALEDRIDITDEVLLEEISSYDKICAHACTPGDSRDFGDNLRYLPCCWDCNSCPKHFYSNETNSNKCHECGVTQFSNLNKTGCIEQEENYIRVEKPVLFVAGLAAACFGVVLVILFSVIIFKNEHRPVIKASDPGYLYMILFSLFLGFPTGFLPLIKPAQQSCSTEYVCAVVFVTLLSINLFYKSIKVYEIFAASQSFGKPKFGFLLTPSGQLILNAGTLCITATLLVIDRFTGNTGFSWHFGKAQEMDHGAWYLMCTSSSPAMMIPVLIIPFTAFIVTLYLCFKMRHFPHNFRESLNIFSATVLVLLCCVMFLGGYQVSPIIIKAFLRAVVIFVASLSFLLSIFIPKIIILLKADVDVEAERAAIKDNVKAFAAAPSEAKINFADLARAVKNKG